MEVCRCARCGRQVRAAHPDVPSDQTGATDHRAGERAKALSLGIPVRRVPRVLCLLGGIRVTHSAFVQTSLARSGRKEAKEAYARLRGRSRKRRQSTPTTPAG